MDFADVQEGRAAKAGRIKDFEIPEGESGSDEPKRELPDFRVQAGLRANPVLKGKAQDRVQRQKEKDDEYRCQQQQPEDPF